MITLDNVRALDFKLVQRFIETQNIVNFQDNNLTYPLNALTLDSGLVLFPIALLNNDSCIENGKTGHQNSLCQDFKNVSDINKLLIDHQMAVYSDQSLIRIDETHALLYKKFANGTILIGGAGKYLGFNEFHNIITYFRTDWIEILTTQKGIKKVWDKGHFIIYITFTVSLAFWLLYLYISHRNRKAYEDLKKQSDNLNTDWEKLNEDYLQLLQNRMALENQLQSYTSESTTDFDSAATTSEMIATLSNEKEQIDQAITHTKSALLDLEKQESDLEILIENSYAKLNAIDQKTESSTLIEKLGRIKLLWRRGPSWKERRNLESELSENDTFIPFTISQSFIVFEKNVVRVAAKRFKNYSDEMSLFDAIELIKNEGKIKAKDVDMMHSIRKARNEWFHGGIRPSSKDIDDLIDFLNEFNVDPELI